MCTAGGLFTPTRVAGSIPVSRPSLSPPALVLDVTSVLGRIVVGPVDAVVDVAPAGKLFLERGVNGTVPPGMV
jgi:hypothetical protein